jgi:hypothetical protein
VQRRRHHVREVVQAQRRRVAEQALRLVLPIPRPDVIRVDVVLVVRLLGGRADLVVRGFDRVKANHGAFEYAEAKVTTISEELCEPFLPFSRPLH